MLPGILQGVISFAQATQYDEFVDDNSGAGWSTISNGWVEISKFTVPEERDDGKYTVQWSLDTGQSKGGRNYGIQISYRLGDDGDANPWTIIESIPNLQVSSDNASLLFAGFKNIDIATTGLFQVRVEHGQTTNGGSSLVDSIDLITFKVGDI